MTPQLTAYWEAFKSSRGRGDALPYDVFKIGNTIESANEGLKLILSGQKSSTSSLPEEYSDKRQPMPGDLSIVTNGLDEPGAVVETIETELVVFDEVDEAFAKAYGEWDRTLATWKRNNSAYYTSLCRQLGIEWHEKRHLICEYFKVVHSNGAINTGINGG